MLISMMSSPLAGYLDDWTDEALCGWMEQPSPPEYIVKEVKKRAIFCNNALPVDPKAASDKSLNALKNSGIKIYDIIFSDEIKEELIKLVPLSSIEGYINLFKNYQLAYVQDQISCSFNIKKASYDENYEGTIQNREIANGSIYFKGTDVTFDGQWKMGGLSNDPKYFNEEVDIRLTKDGHFVGKMAYFNLLVEKDAASENPMYVELQKHPQSKPFNYKEYNKSAEIWINIGTSAGGVMKISNCKDRKQIEKDGKQIEVASELPLFEIEDEAFNLKLEKADFIATYPPQKQDRTNDFQLHKSFIQGSLRLSSGKEIVFSTTVFKQDLDNEEKLVIYVGDDFGEPAMEPFTLHRDSLQIKCRSELMNQWGWLSFISKTSDTKNARNQQCHYDYFKGANDSEAWELFQAVLGGTDSILDYLEANVE